MIALTEWQIVRHQVAIGGCVVDVDGQPVAKAEIMITSMPDRFKRLLEGAAAAAKDWEQAKRRLDRTVVENDGFYYFLDLPVGKYRVRAADPKSGKHSEKTVSVSKDEAQNIKMARADFKFG